MTPKTNKTTKSANVRNDGSKPSSDVIDQKKGSNDPRLKSILQLIETQLTPIQEVMIYYAKAILDKTRALKSRQATLAKFRKTISNKNTTANDTSTPSFSFYIPKSARVKITLTYSNALKNETEIKDLEEELKESINIFGTRVACIFERTARLEETQEKNSRLHTFLTYCLKLIQGFIIIAKQTQFTLETTLNTEALELWTLIVLLRNFKTITVCGLKIYEQYLEVNYNEVKTNFIKIFLPGYTPPENGEDAENDIFFRRGTEDEQKFVCAVVEQVENLIIPTTFKLQLELDKQEEKQNIMSMIAAKYKRSEILTATEATALAIHDISSSSSNNTNMEQHIKKLIDEAINKKFKTSSTAPSTPQQRKRKNSQGSKKPQSWLPKNKRGEKNKSFRYPVPEKNTNKKGEEEEEEEVQQSHQQKMKKQKRSHQEHQQKPSRTPNTTKNASKNQNGKETQEGKKKEATKEK
jgi:hypothetical protein